MKSCEPVSDRVTVLVDDVALTLAAGSSVAAALAARPPYGTRLSVQGEPRAAFCGMGICHECRCTIDGVRRLACQTTCAEGMRIERELLPPHAGENDD